MIMRIIFRCSANRSNVFVRYKHKDTHWSVIRKKKSATTKALEHFDDFYKQVFVNDWPAIRQGLLTKPKHVAVLNNFSDMEQIKGKLENIGALNIRTLFKLEKDYIKSDYEKFRKSKHLEKIRKIDLQLEGAQEVKGNVNSSCEVNIKENVNTQILSNDGNSESKKEQSRSFSLESDLKQAEFDMSRIVDSQNTLSAANLYEFIPVTKIKGQEDWIPESSHYKYYSNSEFPVKVEKEYDIHFPEYLNIYCYETTNHTDFQSPKKGTTGVYDYYLMDGGSVLPVLALDIRSGSKILDMCASPGGKSFVALQTLYPECVISNDITASRVKRIYNVLNQYFYDLDEKWLKTGKIKVTQIDGSEIQLDDFDRILVDVPCTTDRHSLNEDDNNIFKAERIKERLKLPELQCQLLVRALKIISTGGVVVYSTCTLSPIQNDGVVHMALKQVWEETKLDFVVKDLSPALMQTRRIFKLADRRLLKYGHLIVPNVNVNFGPTYFCKIQRVK